MAPKNLKIEEMELSYGWENARRFKRLANCNDK